MSHDAIQSLSGTVDKIIRPLVPGEAEKVQISVHGSDEPDQKIRIPNGFTNVRGDKVALKQGSSIHLTVREKPQLEEGIKELEEQQADARKKAVYLPMSPDETRAYAAKAYRIVHLTEKLQSLRLAHEVLSRESSNVK
jgi:hypothetical protein